MSRWRDVVRMLHLMCVRDVMVGVMLAMGIGSLLAWARLLLAAVRVWVL